MNNEPVAWMLADKEAEHIRSIMAVQHDFVPKGCVEIPLYTHPVKELTDEKGRPMTYWGGKANPVKELALTDEEMISIYEKDWSEIKCGLGRAVEQAILRKAQEV